MGSICGDTIAALIPIATFPIINIIATYHVCEML